MTVAELINKLKEIPNETLVLVDGYEGGYSDISISIDVTVSLNVNKESYMGPHDDDPSSNTKAVVLRRVSNPSDN